MASSFLFSFRKLSTSAISPKKHVCIVGAGPAGFYAAQHIAKSLDDIKIDIIEKLPVPFGLVRFGVAPDHPEVKNVINTFTKTAQNEKVNFYGNITLGKDISLSQLRDNYHAVLLAYGSEEENKFGVPNEDSTNILSAKGFVGWYNGVPEDQNLKVDLSGTSVAVLGQGNVAMDVARILLSPINVLKKTDITEYALSALSQSKVKHVHLIGRRGPLQAAFTIKELREQIKMADCKTIWRDSDFSNIENILNDLPRPRKRLTELMLKSLSEMDNKLPHKRIFFPVFFRSPVKFLNSDSGKVKGIELVINRLIGEDVLTQSCECTEQREILNCNMVLRSIGYKSVQADSDINFDDAKGKVVSRSGRVLAKDSNKGVEIEGNMVDPGLYVTGWLRTGPVGVILSTMSNGFEVGANICKDFHSNLLKGDVKREGFKGFKYILDEKNVQVVDWEGWEKIDKHEIKTGEKYGKPREKISNVKEMLEICS